MGTPGFAAHQLEALIKSRHHVVGVVTVPDKPSGRGLKVYPAAVKQTANQHEIPVLQPEKLKAPEFAERLKSLNADVFVVVAFRMLPETIWNMPRLGTFNLHASLLPDYRGAAPINWAIINGETETGLTTFLIDHQIDTGNLLLQSRIPIAPKETAGTLHDKLMAAGPDLILRTLEGLASGQIQPHPQPNRVAKQAPKIFKETCQINWSKSAEEIHNLVRGMHPMPLAWSDLSMDGLMVSPVKFHQISISEEIFSDQIGAVTVHNKQVFIQTGQGSVVIEQIQLPGKKTITGTDFMNGWRGNHLVFS
jgi:methionyl-tRNA formyltransferase